MGWGPCEVVEIQGQTQRSTGGQCLRGQSASLRYSGGKLGDSAGASPRRGPDKCSLVPFVVLSTPLCGNTHSMHMASSGVFSPPSSPLKKKKSLKFII